MIAGSQRTIGTRYLINITIGFKQLKRLFSQRDITRMVSQSLQCLRLEIGIVATVGNRQTALQTLYLVSTNLFGAAIGQHTSGTNVIKVVQILRRITTGNLCIHRLDSLHRLALQTDIIVVGGVDNSHLRLCIVHAAL